MSDDTGEVTYLVVKIVGDKTSRMSRLRAIRTWLHAEFENGSDAPFNPPADETGYTHPILYQMVDEAYSEGLNHARRVAALVHEDKRTVGQRFKDRNPGKSIFDREARAQDERDHGGEEV